MTNGWPNVYVEGGKISQKILTRGIWIPPPSIIDYVTRPSHHQGNRNRFYALNIQDHGVRYQSIYKVKTTIIMLCYVWCLSLLKLSNFNECFSFHGNS